MRTCIFLFAATSAALVGQQNDIVVSAGAATVSGPTTVAVFGGELVGAPALTGAPYSADAVTETTQLLSDGNRIVNKSTSKIYRDSAGRERREQALPNFAMVGSKGPAPVTIMISDPVAKVNYTLEPNSKTAIRMPGPPAFTTAAVTGAMVGDGFARTGAIGAQVMIYGGQAAATSNRVFVAPSPEKREDLGRRMIEGVSAEGTRTTTTIPAGQMGNDLPISVVSERWYSSDLQVVVMSKHSDPRMGESTYQLTNISRAEPLPTLFEVPTDYHVEDMSSGIRRVRDIQIEGTVKHDDF
jgi:hypothetical protein